MESLTPRKRKELLSKLYWDLDYSPEYIENLLNNADKDNNSIEIINLYRRLLKTFDWYTLLKLVPPHQLKHLLSDDVIKGIHPRELQNKYVYARRILSK